MRYGVICVWVLAACVVTGCATPNPRAADEMYSAYERGDYPTAYARATEVAQHGGPALADTANYMAGMSAYRMGDTANAVRYLTLASRSKDRVTAGDARSTLGLVEASRNNHDAAIRHFLAAAETGTGENKAQALYRAGLSMQKLGQWTQARSTLIAARNASKDEKLIAEVEGQLEATGFTIQTGAFAERDNAERAAGVLVEKAMNNRIGPPRIVRATDVKGLTLWLVQVGQFSTVDSANRAKQVMGFPSAIVVPMTPVK